MLDTRFIRRPIIQLNDPDVMTAIHAALLAIEADIVVDDDGTLVASYDGHFWRQNNNARMQDCLQRHLRFMRGDRAIDPPAALARKFFRLARELHWFKHEHRGPCPRCDLRVREQLSKKEELAFS
jgi:hypothetical protein